MSKLIDTQLVLLSNAAQREDRIVVPPGHLNGSVATKVLKPLLRSRFVEEVPAKNGYPIYRRDPDVGPIVLRVTDKGLSVIGIEPEEPTSSGEAIQEAAKKRSRKAGKPKRKAVLKTATTTRAGGGMVKAGGSSAKQSKPGAKQALLIEMLQAKRGANIDAIVKATGWLPHTGRAMISGLRKAGFKIEVARAEGQKTVYRIVGGPKASDRV